MNYELQIMTKIIFYEKPGCINNTKQKALLQEARHDLEVSNLLTQAWTPETLRPFFGDLPVSQWFNRTAPQVKSEEVIPEKLDEKTALALMVANPILIRRPLIQVGDRHEIGFNLEAINKWIGLQAKNDNFLSQDLETCPRAQ
jgi:nitrogenase-associated protein